MQAALRFSLGYIGLRQPGSHGPAFSPLGGQVSGPMLAGGRRDEPAAPWRPPSARETPVRGQPGRDRCTQGAVFHAGS